MTLSERLERWLRSGMEMVCQQDWFCPVLKHIWTWDIIREGEIEYKFEGLTHLVPSDPFADLCFSSWEALGGSGRATAGRLAATLIRGGSSTVVVRHV